VLSEVARAQAVDPTLGIQGVHFFTFASLAKTVATQFAFSLNERVF
jgi:hypothetical protein